jgi:hypothetical protein
VSGPLTARSKSNQLYSRSLSIWTNRLASRRYYTDKSNKKIGRTKTQVLRAIESYDIANKGFSVRRDLGQSSWRLAVGIIPFTTDATCESACLLHESDALTSSDRKCDLGAAIRRLCGKSGDGDSEQPSRPDTRLDLKAALRI